MRWPDLDPILEPASSCDRRTLAGDVRNEPEIGKVSLALLPFDLRNDAGTLITAAARNDYPTELEMLLLRVAVHQTTMALQQQAFLQHQLHADAQIEQRIANRTAQLTEANRKLQMLKDELAIELGAMVRLHEFSTRLLWTGELQAVLDQMLVATMGLQRADFALVQLNDAERGGLVIAAQRNLPPWFLDQFALVRGNDTVCGRAAQSRERVIVEDVETDAGFAPHRQIAAQVGFRAVYSMPLISQPGELLGVLSTHFRKPHRPSESQLRLTDFYANYAIQMIERSRAEEERSKLASIVENSSDFIGIASLAGQVLFLNAAGRRMIGLSEDEPVLEEMLSYVAPEDHQHLMQQVLPTVERAGFWDGEISLRDIRSQVRIPVLQHIFYILEPRTGRRLGLATVCRNVMERRRAERAAIKAQQELARVTRVMSMGELTSSIAHEINQPLAAIIANGNACRHWIERDVPDTQQAKASLDSIVRDASRASDVIRRIRAFATKATLSRSPVDVNDIIREVLALTSYEIGREQVTLETHLTEGLPTVLADRVELQQVVLNLVLNSIEAMRSVSGRARSLLISSHRHNASALEVCVRDSGTGIENHDLGRLFEAFFTTKSQGMGLGLSISRRIIDAHGGQLRATINPDHGLTLSFTLPDGEPSSE